MVRGFSLIELLVAVVIVGVIANASIPLFGQTINRNRAKGFVTELEWFLIAAKSESIARNQILSVHYVRNDENHNHYQSDGEWLIALVTKQNSEEIIDIATAQSNAITLLNGEKFKGIDFKIGHMSFQQFDIEPIRGSSNRSGSYWIQDSSEQQVKVMMNVGTGRIRSCGYSGSYLGYRHC